MSLMGLSAYPLAADMLSHRLWCLWRIAALELSRLTAARFHSYAARRCGDLTSDHAINASDVTSDQPLMKPSLNEAGEWSRFRSGQNAGKKAGRRALARGGYAGHPASIAARARTATQAGFSLLIQCGDRPER